VNYFVIVTFFSVNDSIKSIFFQEGSEKKDLFLRRFQKILFHARWFHLILKKSPLKTVRQPEPVPLPRRAAREERPSGEIFAEESQDLSNFR